MWTLAVKERVNAEVHLMQGAIIRSPAASVDCGGVASWKCL